MGEGRERRNCIYKMDKMDGTAFWFFLGVL
jgi:hypothetical protein